MNDDMTWKEVKREVGELAHMEHEMLQARESRDHWKAKCERMERDLYERYAELPTDAAGKTVRPGARVTHAGKLWVVWALVLNEGGWLLDCQPRDGEPPAGRTVKPEDCVVVERRTVEDVLREVVTLCHNTWKEESTFHFYDVDDVMKSGNIAEYADEIRQILGVSS